VLRRIGWTLLGGISTGQDQVGGRPNIPTDWSRATQHLPDCPTSPHDSPKPYRLSPIKWLWHVQRVQRWAKPAETRRRKVCRSIASAAICMPTISVRGAFKSAPPVIEKTQLSRK
jgi:hypothetical protein